MTLEQPRKKGATGEYTGLSTLRIHTLGENLEVQR
jgi:hypothetical protein